MVMDPAAFVRGIYRRLLRSGLHYPLKFNSSHIILVGKELFRSTPCSGVARGTNTVAFLRNSISLTDTRETRHSFRRTRTQIVQQDLVTAITHHDHHRAREWDAVLKNQKRIRPAFKRIQDTANLQWESTLRLLQARQDLTIIHAWSRFSEQSQEGNPAKGGQEAPAAKGNKGR